MRRTLVAGALCVIMMIVLSVIGQYEFVSGQILYSAISVVLFAVSGVLLKILSPKTPFVKFFRIKRPKLRNFFLVFWGCLVLVLGSFLLNYLTSFVCAQMKLEASSTLVSAFSSGDMVVSVLTIAVIPAFIEEFFFRGAVMSFVKEKSVLFSVIISAVLFTLMHGADIYFLSTLYAGIILAFVVSVTGNVFSSVIMHFVNNIMSYVLILYAEKLAIVKMDFVMVCIAILLFLLCSVFLLTVVINRYSKKEKKNKTEGESLWEDRPQAAD